MYIANLRYHILSISFSYSFLLHNLQIHRYGVDRITRLISNSVIGESVCSTCMHAKLGWSRSAITGRVCLLLENARLILTVDKLSWYHIIRKRWIFFRMFLFFSFSFDVEIHGEIGNYWVKRAWSWLTTISPFLCSFLPNEDEFKEQINRLIIGELSSPFPVHN